MAVDDLWYLRQIGPDGKRLPSKRHGRGKRWRVRYLDDLGETKTALFTKRAEADTYDAEKRTDVARGVYIEPAATRETLGAYAARWLELQRATSRRSTWERLERTVRLHITPHLGKVALGAMRRSTVIGWLGKLVEGGMAPSTARVVYSVLAAMMRAAVLDRAIAASPCLDIPLPELGDSATPILTPAQVHSVATAVPRRSRAGVYLGAGCGLRLGEVLGLEREHVDLEARTVEVRQQMVTNGLGTYLGPPKSGLSRRTLDLPAWTVAALRDHFNEGLDQEVALTDRTEPSRPVDRPARLLFTSATGLPARRGVATEEFRAAVGRVEGCPPVTFHALRHHFATLLIFGGASVKSVQLALGHSNPTITLNTYVGLWPEQVDRTRALVDDALGLPQAA